MCLVLPYAVKGEVCTQFCPDRHIASRLELHFLDCDNYYHCYTQVHCEQLISPVTVASALVQ